MKTALMQVEVVTLCCPACLHTCADPRTGAENLTEQDHRELPGVLHCTMCGETYRKPAWPTQRQRRPS